MKFYIFSKIFLLKFHLFLILPFISLKEMRKKNWGRTNNKKGNAFVIEWNHISFLFYVRPHEVLFSFPFPLWANAKKERKGMKVCSSRADLRSLSFILFSHSFAHSLRKRKAFSRVSSFLIKKMHFQSSDWHFLLKKEGHQRLKERRIRNFYNFSIIYD